MVGIGMVRASNKNQKLPKEQFEEQSEDQPEEQNNIQENWSTTLVIYLKEKLCH